MDPAKAITQYVHDVWQIQDGLPQNDVHSVAQTPDGYLWLGTEEGLVRFDGVRFAVFDRSNVKELRDNYIQTLMVGRDGSLWMGTDGGGLTRFHGSWTTYTTREGLLSDHIGCVYEDRERSVWIGTLNGLNRLQKGRLMSYGAQDGAPTGPVMAICEDREGNLWLGSGGGGLARFRDGKFTTYTRRDGLPSDFVQSIYQGRGGSVWIGTDAGGLTEFREGKFATVPIGAGDSKVVAWRIVEDRDGSLWIGTSEDGLRRRRNDKWEAYRTGNGLSDTSVRSLLEDHEGNLWIGTQSGGLNRLVNGKLATFGKEEGLSDNRVISVLEDRAGRLWIGTQSGGLNRLTPGSVTVYKKKNGLPANSVASIWEDPEGSLWLGGLKGLSHLKGGHFARYGAKDGFPTRRIQCVSGDRQGNIWIGSVGSLASGLYRFKDGRVTSYSKKDGLTSNFVFSFLEDHKGALWVGTAGAGLNRFENGRFTTDPAVNRLSQSTIQALYDDNQGNLWIGTGGGGLGRLRFGRLRVYATKDGLFDDAILQILEDDQHYLWMGCDKGIFRVRKSDFDDFDAGKIRSVPYVSYGRADGMRDRECNGLGQPSGWKGKDGRLWFATQGGVVVIDPAHIPLNPSPPPVLIEEVLVDDRLVSRRQGARLSHDSRRLEIHYTALSFAAPSKVRFRYRIDGFDRGWVDAGTRRVAYYTNLPPGAHRFRVIACNNDGVWNEKGAMFEFTLLPAFYQTTWFLLLCLAAAGSLAWVGYKRHVRRVTAVLKIQFGERLSERTRIARELHDTLLQSFQGLMLHFRSARNLLPEQPREAIQALDIGLGRAEEALTEGRDAIQDIRAPSLVGTDLTQAITALGEEFASTERSGTSATFQVVVEGTPRSLHPIVRDEICGVAREALRNAFHHAQASRIEADITYGERLLRLRIRDNGRGIDPNVLDHGGRAGHWGLAGMRERAKLVGLQLEVWSREGAGTEVEVSAPAATVYEKSSRRSWSGLFRRKASENQERRG